MSRAILALALAAACGSKDVTRADDAGPAAAPVAPPPKVSKPTATTVKALGKLKEPGALLFFTPGPVTDQVVGYLGDLGKQAGIAIAVRELDRLTATEEARRFKVTHDGALVLVSGERFDVVDIHTDGPQAADDLARLDASVARVLVRLGREQRQVGMVTQEVADVDRLVVFKQALAALDFDVTMVVPGKEVPSGALAVFLDTGAGPTRPAMESIDRHLARGGSALVAIEPRRGASLGPLEARLGLTLASGSLADPVAHLVMRKDASDAALILTNAFTAHPSLATMGRQPADNGALFAEAGALVERGAPPAGASRVVTIRSMPTAFLDRNRNHRRDGRERPDRYPIAAAVSGAFKAIVIADATWLSDQILRAVPGEQVLLLDAVRWLVGEEAMDEAAPDAPATGEQLTSYPLRSVSAGTAAGGRSALWKVAPDGVRGLRFESRGKTALLERKADGALWGHFERPSPDGPPAARDMPLGAEGEALFAALAAPAVLRTVGPLDATTRARYGLEDGTLTVDVSGGATHTVLVGSRVMGGNDRYAGDPAARVVVILPASLIDPLDQAETRLALHRVLDIDEQAVSRLVVARGDRTREAVKAPAGAWKVAEGSSDEAYLAEEIARSVFRLVPSEFARADRANALTAAGKLTVWAGSASVDVEILSGSGDEYWVATRLTRGLIARVSSGPARRIVEAIDQLLP